MPVFRKGPDALHLCLTQARAKLSTGLDLIMYSETSEQRTHWGQDSCPL